MTQVVGQVREPSVAHFKTRPKTAFDMISTMLRSVETDAVLASAQSCSAAARKPPTTCASHRPSGSLRLAQLECESQAQVARAQPAEQFLQRPRQQHVHLHHLVRGDFPVMFASCLG